MTGTLIAPVGDVTYKTPKLSIVVPVLNEEANIGLLVRSIQRALADHESWELLLVDDGSQDGTAQIAAGLAREVGQLRLLRLARRYGQTAAMQAGFDHAQGEIVVSMDGDLQNDPSDIPRLVEKLNEGYDLVAGYRVRRQDRLVTRKVPSWVANRIIRWITGVPIRDNGCSLKAYRRSLFDRMHLYSDMHRFIPALAAGIAGARIAEMPVRHHPRRWGTTKYGLSRVAKVLADLLTVKMIRSFRYRPLLMFGIGALTAFGIAVLFLTASLLAFTTFREFKASALVLPGAALLWLGLACYLLMLGLIGESVVHEAHRGSAANTPVGHRVLP